MCIIDSDIRVGGVGTNPDIFAVHHGFDTGDDVLETAKETAKGNCAVNHPHWKTKNGGDFPACIRAEDPGNPQISKIDQEKGRYHADNDHNHAFPLLRKLVKQGGHPNMASIALSLIHI